jgi:hypothetical protein
VAFATKGKLAQRMLTRAFAVGVRAQWVVGGTVYGYDELRSWLEAQEQPYVLAVPETHPVWMQGRQQPVGLVAALLPEEAWVPLLAGEGAEAATPVRVGLAGGRCRASGTWQVALVDADPAEPVPTE